MKNIYYLAIQSVNKSLKSMINILEKTKTHILENNLDESEFISKRLAPDMFDFKKQIQMLSDNAKGMTSRFAGIENPKWEDNETTIDQLIERLQKTQDFVSQVSEEQLRNAENIKIELGFIPGMYQTGEGYLQNYAIPNFFFHLTVAYSILRANGVNLGKSDYIGQLELIPLE
jgi:hypothetical protein